MKNNHGQAMIEYLLIIAVITLVIVLLFNFFGGYVRDYSTEKSCDLLGGTYEAGENPGDGMCIESDK